MKSKLGKLQAVAAGVLCLMAMQAQADVIKNAVRLGGFALFIGDSTVPLTTSGVTSVAFSGSGKFTIWYTAECAASGYVDVDIVVDFEQLGPTGANDNDSFCDFNTRGATHTVTGRTASLTAGTHYVHIVARKIDGVAYLSDSSLLIGK